MLDGREPRLTECRADEWEGMVWVNGIAQPTWCVYFDGERPVLVEVYSRRVGRADSLYVCDGEVLREIMSGEITVALRRRPLDAD